MPVSIVQGIEDNPGLDARGRGGRAVRLALLVYPLASGRALPLIWVLNGLGVGVIGRQSVHFGASGLDHGLMFFLFVLGVARRDKRAIAAALATFFLYGGMLLTVLPREP